MVAGGVVGGSAVAWGEEPEVRRMKSEGKGVDGGVGVIMAWRRGGLWETG